MYNFSGLSGDQLDKFEKRLASIKKAFMKEYLIALHVIDDKKMNDEQQDIKQRLDDMFNDANKKCLNSYKGLMNNVDDFLINSLNR
jgi:uncharacterized protein YktB (UPF0637 family)